jgi:hypothetical protein
MRTTISIPDDLLRRARKAAMERSCTLSVLVEEALLKALSAAVRSPSSDPTRLLTFSGRGVLPGVDLDSTAELLDRMEGR